MHAHLCCSELADPKLGYTRVKPCCVCEVSRGLRPISQASEAFAAALVGASKERVGLYRGVAGFQGTRVVLHGELRSRYIGMQHPHAMG